MTGDSTGWVVLGAGGHARSVVDVLTDDREAFELIAAQGLRAVVAIGAGPARTGLVRELEVPPVVASTATVSPRSVLGAGTVVLEHAHVGPASRVGEAVIVNTGAIVEHDCRVGAGSHVAPGAVLLGGASVGGGVLVGSGARVLPRVSVGAGATIGAGAVVTAHVADGQTVIGVPAVTRGVGRDSRTGGSL